MKWFSRDWAERRLSLEQEDYVRAEWLAHDAALRVEAPAVAALLDLNLHDGQVQEWDSTADTIRWRLLVGDLETGYEHATIEYVGAHLVGDSDALADLRLMANDVEVLYDEVDVATDGGFLHRVLLWPEGELWVRFDAVSVARAPARPEDRR